MIGEGGRSVASVGYTKVRVVAGGRMVTEQKFR
jgi:hypothetical protein